MADVEAADHAEALHAVLEALFGDIDGVFDAEFARQAEAPVVDVGERSVASRASVWTTLRAPLWRAMAAAMMPMGPAPVTRTS